MNKPWIIILVSILFFSSALNAQSGSGDNLVSTKKTIVKVRPMAVYLGALSFGVEHKIKDGMSAEISYGLGMDRPLGHPGDGGFFISAAPRFYLSKKNYDGLPGSAPLLGGYFKPELMYSSIETINLLSSTMEEIGYKARSVAIFMNLGHQFTFLNVVAIDLSCGVGVGISDYEYINKDRPTVTGGVNGEFDNPIFYSHYQGPKSVPIAAKFNIGIGYMFNRTH